jgi:hypothetical protein
MSKENYKIEVILSPIELRSKDPKELNSSLIWKNAWKQEEVTEEAKRQYKTWWKYSIKFDGLKPIQVTKMERV